MVKSRYVREPVHSPLLPYNFRHVHFSSKIKMRYIPVSYVNLMGRGVEINMAMSKVPENCCN